MAQVINTNIAALFASAALTKSQQALQTAQEQLSSGLRINSVADDPTGLVNATNYQSQINGTNIAIENANNAINGAQTNDGYAAQVVANLQQLYQIAVENGAATDAQAKALIAENARIAGLSTADTSATVDGSGNTVTAVGTALTVVSNTSATGILTDITTITTARANYGADIATFSSAVATMQTTSVNLNSSYAAIMDTDYASTTTTMTRNNILQQAGMAALAQANQTPSLVLTLLK